MPNVQRVDRDQDHDALQDDVVRLRPVELTGPAASKLDNSVDRPDEDCHDGQAEKSHKDSKLVVADRPVELNSTGLLHLAGAPDVLERNEDED